MRRTQEDPLVVTQFDEMELYDRAMIGKLVYTLNDKSVPIVMATAQRAFAAPSHLYGTESVRPPLPSGELQRTEITNAPSRGFGRKRMVVNYPTEDHGFVKVAQPPQPVDLAYSMTLWVAKMQQVNSLVKQHEQMFVQNKAYVNVAIPEWGTLCFPINATTLSEDTDDDVGEGERHKRLSCTLTLEAYLFRPIEVRKTVGRITRWIEVVEDV